MSYTEEKQKLLIENLLSSSDLFALCANIVKADYFNPEFRPSINFIHEYYEDHHNIPPLDVVNAETRMGFQTRPISDDVFDYTSKNIEKFCRERAVLKEFVEGSDLIEDETKISGVIERLSAAIQISLFRDLGTDVFENVAERAKNRADDEPYFSTGWPNVDVQLGGGIRKTEFMMFSANSGGGKSVALSNFAISSVRQGLNVLYVSLELAETMICERFETMLTGWDRDTKIEKADELAERVESVKRDNGATIFVKYMEPDTTCTNDIKAYLKQFETQYGFLPDVLVVDYLDILGTNDKRHYQNVYDKDRVSSTQLKTIGSNPRHPMITATASQQNRGAIDQQDVSQGHIAGGLSKVNIVDVYISIIMTDTMRAQGMAFFKFLKTRSSNGVGNRIPMNWDDKYLLFKSTDGDPIIDPPPASEQVGNGQQPTGAKVDEDTMGIDSLFEM